MSLNQYVAAIDVYRTRDGSRPRVVSTTPWYPLTSMPIAVSSFGQSYPTPVVVPLLAFAGRRKHL